MSKANSGGLSWSCSSLPGYHSKSVESITRFNDAATRVPESCFVLENVASRAFCRSEVQGRNLRAAATLPMGAGH